MMCSNKLIISWCLYLYLPFISTFSITSSNNLFASPNLDEKLNVRLLRSFKTSEEEDPSTGERDTITIGKPPIHWTVPNLKVGWKDEDGNWFDEDGPRNGPPQNYWRQSMDNREYSKDMDVVNKALLNIDITDAIKTIEKRNSVRKPSKNRLLLGKWAPIVRCGVNVALSNKSFDECVEIELPMTVDIFRTAGRKFVTVKVYGVFDARLDEGEELSIQTSDGVIDKKIQANASNELIKLGTIGGRPFRIGGITYLSDYLLILRGPDEEIDLWLRCDDAYLGRNEIPEI